MSGLVDLSIIFITKNRYPYLARNLKLWENSGAQIFVLDASDLPKGPQIMLAFPNIIYIHMPASIEARLFVVQKLITTTYSMLAADDDMIISSGAEACIKELENDSELVAVSGLPIGFKITAGEVAYFNVYPRFKTNGCILNSGPWSRAYNHFKQYESVSVYGVLRTETFKKICKVFEDSTVLHNNLFELFFEFSASYLGKIKVIDHVYCLRSQECAAGWSSTEPYAMFPLSLNYPNRRKILLNLDKEILSVRSRTWSGVRIFLFLLILSSRELSNLCSRFSIRVGLRWLLLVPAFLWINFRLHLKSDLIYSKTKSKTFKRTSSFFKFRGHPPLSISNIDTSLIHLELNKYTEIIESFHKLHGRAM